MDFTTAQYTEIRFPKLDYGWLEGLIRQRSKYQFQLPPGVILIATPTINISHADYIALGCSGVNCNDGQSHAGVPMSQKAVMAGKNFIASVGKPIRDFTPEDEDTAVANFYASPASAGVGYKVITTQVGERTNDQNGNPSSDNIYAYDYGTPKTRNVRRKLADAGTALGCITFDEYDGHSYLDSKIASDGEGQFRAVLSGGNAAVYNYLKTTPLGFHSYSYWMDDEYLWRGGIIQTYYTVDGTLAGCNRWVFSKLMAFHMDHMAKKHVGTSSPTIGFGFPAGTDFARHTAIYQRELALGGTMQGSHQPKYSAADCVIVHLFPLIMAAGAFGWQSTQVDGQNPNIIPLDGPSYTDNNGNVVLSPQRLLGSTTAQRIAPGNGAVGTQTNPAPFPANPRGHDDLVIIAGYLYAQSWMWTGSRTWTYGKVKRPNGTIPAVNFDTYPLDQHEAQAGICFIVGENSKRTIYFYTTHRNQGQWASETVEIEGRQFTFQAQGHVPKVFNIQL